MKRWLGLLAASFLVAGCSHDLSVPVRVDSSADVLDLRTWDFAHQGPVIPQGWLWDPGILWEPVGIGRPANLPNAVPLGPLDAGGSFSAALGNGGPLVPAQATAWLKVLVPGNQNFGLKIGAFPGACRVWVNGVLVEDTGVLSVDPSRYRPGNPGKVLTVQPVQGTISIVADLVTADPLVRRTELNRLWVLGPDDPMMQSEAIETGSRAAQTTVLALGAGVFFWISWLRPGLRSLGPFVAFLVVCVLKLLFNVEQPEPFLTAIFPEIPSSVFIFLNHGLNLLPFPLFCLFLVRQFPEEVSLRSCVILAVVTAIVGLWELFPFVALALGWGEGYEAVMRLPWSFVLNLYVVVVTLFLFETFYQIYRKKRPLAAGLLYGGIVLGLVVLIPILLSFFMPVNYTSFFGWGIFVYLTLLALDLIRVQIASSVAENRRLAEQVERQQTLTRFVASPWASWLGKDSVEAIRPSDRRSADAIFLRVTGPVDVDSWFTAVGELAKVRKSVLIDWTPGGGTWAMEAWSETGLAFGLEIQGVLKTLGLVHYRIVLCRAPVNFHVLDLDSQWYPTLSGVPTERLNRLDALADQAGVALALDDNLRDGLSIGGWHRHRRFTLEGNETELYELDDEELARQKDQTASGLEAGLALARAGHRAEALGAIRLIVQQSPRDRAAQALQTELSR